MKLAEVRETPAAHLTIEEAARIRPQGQSETVTRQSGLRSFAASWLQHRDGLAAARSLPRPPRPQASARKSRAVSSRIR